MTEPEKRRGGRPKGALNKRTLEKIAREKVVEQLKEEARRAELSAEAFDDARRNRKKLAKDILEDFTMLFAGMAAAYQPYPGSHIEKRNGQETTVNDNPNMNEGQFVKYASLAVDAANKLAPFQSPTYRAIQIAAPAPAIETAERRRTFRLTVFEGGKISTGLAIEDASNKAEQ
jgi:hypothetical protein